LKPSDQNYGLGLSVSLKASHVTRKS